eukprot:627858-Pyramimonas_sp.AAC.1
MKNFAHQPCHLRRGSPRSESVRVGVGWAQLVPEPGTQCSHIPCLKVGRLTDPAQIPKCTRMAIAVPMGPEERTAEK